MPLTDQGIPGGGLIVVAIILLGIGYGSWIWFTSSPRSTVAAVEPVPPEMLPPPIAAPKPEEPASTTAPETQVPGQSASDTPSPAVQASVPTAGTQTAAPPEPAPTLPASPPPATAAAQPATPPVAAAQVAALAPSADTAQPHVFGSPTPGAIVIKATADTWMEMLDNNVSVWSRLMHAGDVYNVPKDGLVMRTGNAGGIEVSVNGKVLPPIGQTGQIKRLALDASKLTGG